jgi:hypothetical protein
VILAIVLGTMIVLLILFIAFLSRGPKGSIDEE